MPRRWVARLRAVKTVQGPWDENANQSPSGPQSSINEKLEPASSGSQVLFYGCHTVPLEMLFKSVNQG